MQEDGEREIKESPLDDLWTRLEAIRKEAASSGAEWPAERVEQLARELKTIRHEGMRRNEEREALLREVALVLSCTGVRRVLELIMDAVVRLSGAERGYLILARADGSQEVAAARNMRRDSARGTAAEISTRVVGSVITEGQPVRLADALNTPPFSLAESVTRLKLLSVLCVPVRSDGRVIGAIYLENRKASGVFTEEVEGIVTEFAERIGAAIRNAETMEQLRRSREELRVMLGGEYGFEGVVGSHAGFRKALETAVIAARSDIPILIEGESGTGKELLARVIHLRSPRCDASFVSMNCAALPHTLLESELFGHTRGAFTGAVRDRRGLFATANKGTLFLDEIGEMPLELQAKLLRILQSGEYRPVGSDRTFISDVRIVAATQRVLAKEVKAKRFRQDLFFRLNGVMVRVPPLRERKEDIPLLIERFIEKFRRRDKEITLDREAMACLLAYDYPGNVRELETVIRRAVLFAHDGCIGIEALPEDVVGDYGKAPGLPLRVPETAGELLRAKGRAKLNAVAEVECAFLKKALAAAGGRPGEAARRAGMNRSQFARMLSKHGLSLDRNRKPETGT